MECMVAQTQNNIKMVTYVNKLNEEKVDSFLNNMGIKYSKENSATSINVLKYTILSHKENHRMLFIVDEVLERFHELLLRR